MGLIEQRNINDMMFANAANAGGSMGSRIEDGLGSGREVAVSKMNELSVTPGGAFQAAVLRGDAYHWLTATADINTGDTMLIVRNELSDRLLVIQSITIVNGNVAACTYDIHLVTAPYANVGTDIVGTNLLAGGSAIGGKVTATGDETGNVQGTVLMDYIFTTASIWDEIDFTPMKAGGIALSEGTALGVDQITESTAGQVGMVGYFVDKP